jgi:hypothetical protein
MRGLNTIYERGGAAEPGVHVPTYIYTTSERQVGALSWPPTVTVYNICILDAAHCWYTLEARVRVYTERAGLLEADDHLNLRRVQ